MRWIPAVPHVALTTVRSVSNAECVLAINGAGLGLSKRGCISSRSPMFSQRCFYTVGRDGAVKYRNVVENTLADTPSGYIQDPANYPPQMVTYNKVTPEAQATLDEMERERELMNREELMYKGCTTKAIQEAKAIIFKGDAAQKEIELACVTLQKSLEELVELLGNTVNKGCSDGVVFLVPVRKSEEGERSSEEHVVNIDDCNHVRYVIALGKRRLGDFDGSERMCMDILSIDHGSCDALECLLEIYTGTAQPVKIRGLLDQLVRWKTEKNTEEQSMEGNAAKITTKLKNNQLELVEVALVLLSDIIVEAASLYYLEHKEGSTSRYFYEAILPISRALGRQYTSLLLGSLFRCLDEQHLASLLRGTTLHESEYTMGLVISFLKMLMACKLFREVDDPLRFEFQILSKLHAALRLSGRKHESYKICERLIHLYRANSLKYRFSIGNNASEDNVDLLDDLESEYKTALFQYVEDRALDSLVVGKRLCIQAIEEYPAESAPWETLALIIHKEQPVSGLDDAIVAARKAFSLDPLNLRIILTLANFYRAQGRHTLCQAMIDHYKLLKYFIEINASEEDIKATLDDIEKLETDYPIEREPNHVVTQFADMKEHMERMEMSHTYSMPIDKEPRVFGAQPVTVPILDPSINVDQPERPRDM
ncbi:hypothetical protein, conserved [Trypanosoma brucei gambiense DAL972]|uniref:Uncharacterized protein n=1 Tax=Trypanosoma brucei gambiense (strain MHOM/CI/86/DAL972) TaxID=679716 RepID=C9ZV34_TRYB9|nr:hypothetical protein, conserved [Trypanosoma brucei gambiense DAL972]CBH13272.1 hypothetical protein, conserved [Trypanosoma brucei gambiense DAL972]|eukprot:XP_011775549.1 hypothetical protein, conserved [Trypanosoma brucei gambiense DAL972]